MTGKKKLKISWVDCEDKSYSKLSEDSYITIFYPFGTIKTYTCIIWTKKVKQVLDDDDLDVIKFKAEMYLNSEVE
jgi:hypothetical protein